MKLKRSSKLLTLLGLTLLLTLLVSGCGDQAPPAPEATPPAPAGPVGEPAAPDAGSPGEATTEPSPGAPDTAVVDPSQYIGEEQAQEIALQHAGVAANDATFIRAEFDFDDGRAEYEVEFYSGNLEYEYEIDAVTGDIVSHSQERI